MANGTVLDSLGSFICVSSGGVLNGTIINSDGYVGVSSGGTANSTTINSGGALYLYGGMASNTTVNNAFMQLISGASASLTTINGGQMHGAPGGAVATSTTINSGGSMTGDFTATSTTINSGGSMTVSGTANDTTVRDGGYMEVIGGAANNTTIHSGGNMKLRKNLIHNTSANNTTIHSGGNMIIESLKAAPNYEINNVTMDGGAITNNWSSSVALNGTVSGYGTLSGTNGFSFPGSMIVDGGTLIGDNAPISADSITIKNGNIATDSNLTVSNTLTVKTIKNPTIPAISTDTLYVGTIDVTDIGAGGTTSGTLVQTNNNLQAIMLTSSTNSGTLTAVNDSVVFGGGSQTDTSIPGFTLAYTEPSATYTRPSNNQINYALNGNKQATKLTFGSIDWLNSGAFIDHNTQFADVVFTGADVDTTNIHFKNVNSLEANKKMTLVSNFGTDVGNISGTKYTVGTTLQGNGKASLSNNDLIYTVETAAQGGTSGGGGSPGTGPSGGGSPGTDPSGGGYPGTDPSGGGYPGTDPSGGGYPGTGPSGGGSPGTDPSGGGSPGTEPNIPSNVTNNTVNSNDDHNGDIYGGLANDTAASNVLNVTGGTINGNLYGGYAGKNAYDNTVNITGGTIQGNVYGGYGGSDKGNNNHVIIGGGKINGDVYGGYSDTGESRNNTITIYGTADLSTANLYGGNRGYEGNILYVGDAETKTPWIGGNQSVKNIANFATIDYKVVPWSQEKAALTITDGSLSDLSYTTVRADNIHFTDIDILRRWDTITLLDEERIADSTKKLSAKNIVADSRYTVGTTGEGKGTLSLDEKGNVRYLVETDSEGTPIVTAQEQTHNTVMGMEASLAVLDAGRDFIDKTTEGLAKDSSRGDDGIAVFAAMGGGSEKYSTGSHIKADTWNGIIGIGKSTKLNDGSLEVGGFVEHGSGKFSLHGGDNTYGDGSTKYTGGGVLAKWTSGKDVYLEGSLRMGRTHDTASNVLRDVLGNSYGYNIRSNYYGGHIGLGKVFHLGDDKTLDVYGKFYATKRNGGSFDAGGQYVLDDLKSNKLRIGARYSSAGNKWNWYGGLAYEHEFDGEASGTADGSPIRSASVKGGSVRAELGVQMKPSETSPWGMNIGLTGYAGKHRGVNGAVTLSYHF